ncbi:hypothetical protein IFM89_024332 [Coptis chinensis]|uniref:Uncharacterized protein n=1 Tax=Coptis chinensis TaxID=261450 RepID=A0A835IY66_9MAGN|nr:hypothetical protein IFM89_024332 [Coptis chinensis]
MHSPEISVIHNEESQFPWPTAPPRPTRFEYPPTATGIPVNSNPLSNNNNGTTVSVVSKHPVPWSTGFCNCFDDISTCCLTCCCPCITFGRIAEMVDRGGTCWHGNMERQKRLDAMAPVAQGGMRR